jgi:L-threonylcarbamoyladenylate synthase
MVKKFGGPITSTSANISTKKSCYSVNEVINQFKNKKFQPDLIIDAGKLPNKKVSKVVKVLDNKVKVLRK